MMTFGELGKVLAEAGQKWVADNVTQHSAALAYFTAFSLAPLLLISISLVSVFFGEEAARGEVAEHFTDLVGAQSAATIQSWLAAAGKTRSDGLWATWVGFGVLLLGATTVFGNLKNSLNLIFGVMPKPGNPVVSIVRDRLLAFSIVLIVGFLLLTSLLASAVLTTVSQFVGNALPLPPFVWKTLDFVVSMASITALFALIFKILPDVELDWRDVGPGASVTALLFTGGKMLIAWYLGTSTVASAFGAAGTLAIVLLWVFYAACILFFGAELTRALAVHRHGHVRPRSTAVRAARVPQKATPTAT